MNTTKLLVALAGAMALASCAGPAMQVAKVENKPPPAIPPGVEMEAIEFAKVVVNLRRGTKIGTYVPAGVILVGPCKDFAEDIFWNQGRVTSRGLEFADIFYEELSGAGFNVVGDPNKMFNQAEERKKAVYSIGARVTEIKMHVCDHVDYWKGLSVGKQSGEASVKVAWQVYSKLGRRVVYETATEGYTKFGGAFGGGVPDGEIVLLQQAFGAAAGNLAADTKFRDLLVLKEAEPVTAAGYATTAISRIAQFNDPVTEHMNEVTGATVTLSLGGGFGSGFVISKDGLIMTNFHVVGDAKRILVEFPSGLRIEGEVLRSHKLRDVALVKVPVRGLQVLPIRAAPARVGEEVYAIGTPYQRDLRASLTRGIVSALRKDKRTKLTLIQSDVDIQGGNSGGPLVDARGNVIGISVSGIGVAKMSAGLNFFIPIHDALAKLNMEIAKK